MESKEITREILRERVRESRQKTDHIHVTVPKGTLKRIAELTGERPSTFCNKVIMRYLEELEE